MSDGDRSADAGCAVLSLIAIAGIVLFQISPLLFYVVLGLLGAVILYVLYSACGKTINHRNIAFLLLTVAAAQTLSIALGNRGIVICFTAASTWFTGLFLLSRHGLRSKKGIAAAVLKNAIELSAVLAVVTGILTAISLVLSYYPPDRIFAWSETFNHAASALEGIERTSKKVLWVLCGIYALMLWKASSRHRFAALWKTGSFTRKWIKRAILATVVAASFAFIANNAQGTNGSDHPVNLDKAKAQALNVYADLCWKVQLQLGKKLQIQAVSALLAALPPSHQQAVLAESKLVRQTAAIPPPYFANPAAHLDATQLLNWGGAEQERKQALLRLLPKVKPPPASPIAAAIPPPDHRELTRSGIGRAAAEADREESATEAPAWMSGAGEEVLHKFFDAGVNTDRVEFLKVLSETHPLLSEILNVVLDSITDVIFEKLHEIAGRIAARAARNGGAGLAADIHEAASETAPKSAPPPVERLLALEDSLRFREQRTRDAGHRLEGDANAAMLEAYKKVIDLGAEMKTLHITIPKASPAPDPLLLGSGSLLMLRTATDRMTAYRDAIAEAIARAPGNSQWREVLGTEYDSLNRKAEKLQAERQRQQDVKRDMDRIDRIIKDRIAEHGASEGK